MGFGFQAYIRCKRGSQPGTWLGSSSAKGRTLSRGYVILAAKVSQPVSPRLNLGICPFDIHLSVSGYAALSRSLSEATRGQRALVSLAKRDDTLAIAVCAAHVKALRPCPVL